MDSKEEVFQNCTVEGNVIKLPDTVLDRKVYVDVKRAIEKINGKWKGGKTKGFVFKDDPTELLEQIAAGVERNLKKEFQYYPTPPELADKLVNIAGIDKSKKYPEQMILEPSAGQGALLDAINKVAHPKQLVHCWELMEENRKIIESRDDVILEGEDFLQNGLSFEAFDIIIANPPFSRGQDIQHILEMYRILKPHGRLVAIASQSWQHVNRKKEVSFRDWLKSKHASIENLPNDAFRSSGANFGSCIISLSK